MKSEIKKILFILLISAILTLWAIDQTAVYSNSRQRKPAADLILEGARHEVKNQVRYDASYAILVFPGGDVSSGVGACTDLVIRALRNAGLDLQLFMHIDIQENPEYYGIKNPDYSIDHRRAVNQMLFFDCYLESLTLEVIGHEKQWQYGDIVYWRTGDDLHTGIISDKKNSKGVPLVIHNSVGRGAKEEDVLLKWKIVGHYRY
ncbi:MAG: DUF1287 domain-containing protein [Methanofastidiosum sp.]